MEHQVAGGRRTEGGACRARGRALPSALAGAKRRRQPELEQSVVIRLDGVSEDGCEKGETEENERRENVMSDVKLKVWGCPRLLGKKI